MHTHMQTKCSNPLIHVYQTLIVYVYSVILPAIGSSLENTIFLAGKLSDYDGALSITKYGSTLCIGMAMV